MGIITKKRNRYYSAPNYFLFYARAQPLGVGGQGPGPLNVFIDPQIFDSFLHGGVGITLLHYNKVDYFKISLLTIYQIERFEVRNSKKFWEGAHQTPFPDPSSRFLGLRFELRPQIWVLRVLASGFTWFRPSNFCCALGFMPYVSKQTHKIIYTEIIDQNVNLPIFGWSIHFIIRTSRKSCKLKFKTRMYYT